MELIQIKEYLKDNKNIEQFYYEGLKERTIEQKYQYIKNHYTYDTMNSWNYIESIANNVKIYKLGLTNEQEEKYFDLMSIDYEYFNYYMEYLFEEFTALTDTDVFFNGRSGGYIVITPKGTNKNIISDYGLEDILYYNNYKDFKQNKQMYSYRNSWKYDIERLYYIIKAFDKFCDVLRSELIYVLNNYRIEEHEETYTRTIKEIVI